MEQQFDVIVVGAGHAGCEAAHASAKMGKQTCLITSSFDNIAMAPCNPSIGGPAKGVVVREVDALGGIMGIIADQAKIQIKMLNSSKGPAVHSLRAQIDKDEYPKLMFNYLKQTPNLSLLKAMVREIIFNDDYTKALGVILDNGERVLAKKTIITTGTYMDSYVINGQDKTSSGPSGYPTTKTLSDSLRQANIELFRLKTGTPARIYTNSIDFSKAQVMPGDEKPQAFSFFNPTYLAKEDSIDCWLIHTNKEVHKIIYDNLDKSAMYSGVIEGVGPRYCPSIEDKLVRFPDKTSHQLFLEPETRDMETIYVQGFSTSMPFDVQDEMIHSLPGFSNARIQKYGYAIEYDALRPEQLTTSLETKKVKNLYTAGQINGTSGYEEAAGQGIVAGINACLSIDGKEPINLNRTNSYIGLMIDDIITKGTNEPYRLLTSRSEYRLYLRHDNADLRLSRLGHEVGLLADEYYQQVVDKQQQIDKLKELLTTLMITPKNLTAELANKLDTKPVNHGITAYDFIKRPNITTKDVLAIFDINEYSQEVMELVDIDIKYEGYINKVIEQVKRQDKLYKQRIPDDIDYSKVDSLALEAREKLEKLRPQTIGIASQISGINPADISVLQIHLEKQRRNHEGVNND